jgi:hypothetical protein
MEMVVKSMETVVEVMESMEMALGALPRPDRVPEQRLLSREIRQWRRRSCRILSRKTPIDLGFGLGRIYIGREVASEVDQGPHTMWWHGPGEGGATPWCGCSLAPLRLSFSLRFAFEKNRRFGLCFVQFREYFLCNFSETQNSRK